LAGIACAIAVLIRPNLAPLALIPFLAARGSRVKFAIPVAAAGATLALLQWQWYGSPLRTGYGTAEELFAFRNISANVSHYAGWLVETSPVMLLAGFGWWLARRRPSVSLMAIFSVSVVAAYLGYAVFTDWSYLRFLLPAIGIGAVLIGVLGTTALARLPAATRAGLALAAMLVLMAHGLTAARSRDVFDHADQQHRIVQIANALSSRLAAGDVIVSGEQSGSMRFYTGREIVRWDALETGEWAATVATLTANGHGVWIVLDAFEEPLFRARLTALDWPPAIEAGETHRTRAWRLSDRTRFAAGENVMTDRIR
jgi:hypothetical protein